MTMALSPNRGTGVELRHALARDSVNFMLSLPYVHEIDGFFASTKNIPTPQKRGLLWSAFTLSEISNFVERLLVLYNYSLLCYNVDVSGKKGRPLYFLRVHCDLRGARIDSCEKDIQRNYGFKVLTAKGRTFYFYSNDAVSGSLWVRAIALAISSWVLDDNGLYSYQAPKSSGDSTSTRLMRLRFEVPAAPVSVMREIAMARRVRATVLSRSVDSGNSSNGGGGNDNSANGGGGGGSITSSLLTVLTSMIRTGDSEQQQLRHRNALQLIEQTPLHVQHQEHDDTVDSERHALHASFTHPPAPASGRLRRAQSMPVVARSATLSKDELGALDSSFYRLTQGPGLGSEDRVAIVSEYLRTVLTTRDHSLGKDLTIASAELCSQLFDLAHSFESSKRKFEDNEGWLETLRQKLRSSISRKVERQALRVTKKLFHLYPFLHADSSTRECSIKVVKEVLLSAAWTPVSDLYRLVYVDEDHVYWTNLNKLEELSLKDLEVPELFWLVTEGGEGGASKDKPYAKAVSMLRSMPGLTSPYRKLDVLVSVWTAITDCIDDVYSHQDGVDVTVGGDEILPLFCFTVIQASVPYLMSDLALCEDLGVVSYAGMESYVLVTCQAAVAFLESLASKV
eukprot:TRINITY_DN8931_c0_g1_i1.p1 TRINITY_DN8931_c0_g1~~TRINITY_DN8931_c0_g1_i1.p1  ORF type:complete len:624 (+),score=131.66 TRINITY_DN8931_c0_g1_i1:168-2039(+)